MVDMNTTNILPPDDIDFDSYDEGSKPSGKAIILPPKGKHTLQTVAIEMGRTQAGHLKATLTLKTVAPGQPYDGHELRFVRLSTKRYSNRNANGMLDYLRAFGIDTRPSTDEEYSQLIARTLNAKFEAGVNWEASDPETQDTVAKDMEDFPIVDGKRLQYLTRSADDDTRLWARARPTYYVSKVAAR